MSNLLSRRGFLGRSAFVGCSLAASPLITPVSFAQTPWDTRLVVIILRGAMDGLDVVRPVGDPAFAALRPNLNDGPQGIDLDGHFALHPALEGLMPLWHKGELGFIHAVSTPYRQKRSHFDGQDLLEAGTQQLGEGVRDGWLNRLLQQVPGAVADTAYAIGDNGLKVLDGAAPVSRWRPGMEMRLDPQTQRLAEMVMEDDPVLHAAFSEALVLSERARKDGKGEDREPHMQVARFAAARLREDARIAAFSISGWDTHRGQPRVLHKNLGRLSEAILQLRHGLRGDWQKTAVVALTEFGRTVRENGTHGTDHGTGGLMLMAGGALRGGRVLGRWPGLDEAALYERRDLMPTGDVRAPLAWIMRGMTGVSTTSLTRDIFPGLDLADDPGLLL